MKEKILGVSVCILLIASTIPLIGAEMVKVGTRSMLSRNGDTVICDDPEIIDDVEDLFGRFAFLPHSLFSHIDIESAWFFEDAGHPALDGGDYILFSDCGAVFNEGFKPQRGVDL